MKSFYEIVFCFTCVGVPLAIINLVHDGTTTFEWTLLVIQIPCFALGWKDILTPKDRKHDKIEPL